MLEVRNEARAARRTAHHHHEPHWKTTADPTLMQTEPATRDEIVGLFGDVDDVLVGRIVDTGATTEELAEVLDLLDAEHLGEPRIASSPRVTEVRQLLVEMTPDDSGDHAPII
jgi:hypothetical protein